MRRNACPWQQNSHTAVAATLATGIALGVGIGALWLQKNDWFRTKLNAATMAGTYVLSDVKIPSSVLPNNEGKDYELDAEGFCLCGVAVSGGKIVSLEKAGAGSKGLMTKFATLDCEGAVLMPCFVDAHTHLVKTHTHPRSRNPTGSINDALFIELNDQARWAACPCCRPIQLTGGSDVIIDEALPPCPNATDVLRRMEFSLATAYHHGTRAIRTHLDGTNSSDPKLRATVYEAYQACRTKYMAKGLDVQGVANLYLPLWAIPSLADPHVAEAIQYEGVILGAYCGNVGNTPPEETLEALDALFGYAQTHKLQVDMHIDETNDPNCCCMRYVVQSLEKARKAGYKEHVVLGHCTALSLQNEKIREEVIQGLARLNKTYDGVVTIVCNPSTNLGLQDRKGSLAPHCIPIDNNKPRTPMWRGLTLVQELDDAGVGVAAASDNVRDFWHPYGDYDALANYRGAVAMGHLDTAPHEGAWGKLVSDIPGLGSELGGSSLAIGAAADLILFPDARSASELFSRPQQSRVVLRKGKIQKSTLPSYRELDDLVATPSRVVTEAEEGETGEKGTRVGM